jgi:hypothetical protein
MEWNGMEGNTSFIVIDRVPSYRLAVTTPLATKDKDNYPE